MSKSPQKPGSGRLLTIGDASAWATEWTGREVTPSNISHLVNYGRIRKEGDGGPTLVSIDELKRYYASWRGRRETDFKRRLGNGLNWRLSFEECKESETTKHVHRLHPYKGKFIPQLCRSQALLGNASPRSSASPL